MERLKFACETVTPMFIAGTDLYSPELRPPSVKGLLRFWWRTSQVGFLKFHEQESLIFGGTGDKVHKSSFSIKINGENLANYRSTELLKKHVYVVKGIDLNILEYIAYGTQERKKLDPANSKSKSGNVYARAYIKPGYKFNIEISIDESRKVRDEIIKALRLFFVFGAIGSKSRNGYGCLRLLSSNLSDNENIQFTEPPGRNLIEPYLMVKDIPSYSAFSSCVKLYRTLKSYYTWDDCLAELGFVYRDCRLALEAKHDYKKRQYIGAPLIVNKRQESILDRHAKPYFMRVYKQGATYTGYILYLPSQYCAGLTKDANNNDINHADVNAKFLRFCNEFNGKLAERMVVLV